MKNFKDSLIMILILLLFFVLGKVFTIYIPCLFHLITGLYCPGCGVTRMIYALASFDFYQAFRYNMLLFILFPFFIFFVLNYFYATYKNKEPLFKKVPQFIWYILIVILILWGILRNIFPYFAPTVI